MSDQNYSAKFEDPIDPMTINVFAVDDYLRMLSDPMKRRQLVQSCIGDQGAAQRYEEENDLPTGAVELAVMLEDPRVRDLTEKVNRAYKETGGDPAKYEQALGEEFALKSGLFKIYPNAQRFLGTYQGRILRTSSQNIVSSEMIMFRRDFCTEAIVCVLGIIFIVMIANVIHVANANTYANANANFNANANANWNTNINANGE